MLNHKRDHYCGELTRANAGQTVHHLHFHILGGQTLALQMA